MSLWTTTRDLLTRDLSSKRTKQRVEKLNRPYKIRCTTLQIRGNSNPSGCTPWWKIIRTCSEARWHVALTQNSLGHTCVVRSRYWTTYAPNCNRAFLTSFNTVKFNGIPCASVDDTNQVTRIGCRASRDNRTHRNFSVNIANLRKVRSPPSDKWQDNYAPTNSST